MACVKGLVLTVALALTGVGCKDRTSAVAPEKKQESPLKTVDEIIAEVEGVNPVNPVNTPEPPLEIPGDSDKDEPVEVEIPIAEPVPDKPGFVISPYNGKWIDVTGIKPGTLMADPHFTEEKKFFRVPEIPEPPKAEAAEGEGGSAGGDGVPPAQDGEPAEETTEESQGPAASGT